MLLHTPPLLHMLEKACGYITERAARSVSVGAGTGGGEETERCQGWFRVTAGSRVFPTARTGRSVLPRVLRDPWHVRA